MNGFEQFLNPGEEVIETIKPHKGRFLLFRLIGSLVVPVILAVGAILLSFLEMTDEDGNVVDNKFGFYIFAGIALLFGIGSIITTIVSYKKTLYAYTNQRVLFRTGFIGRDFQFLDYKNIQGISVYVDFPDKFFNPNPGNILFMSSSMPMMMMGRGAGANQGGYAFHAIPDAYALYQRINEAYNKGKNA